MYQLNPITRQLCQTTDIRSTITALATATTATTAALAATVVAFPRVLHQVFVDTSTHTKAVP